MGEYDTTTNPDCLKSTHSGEINCIDKYVSIPIENIIIHPDYDPSDSFKNDLAIIRLSKEAPNTGKLLKFFINLVKYCTSAFNFVSRYDKTHLFTRK